MTKEELIAVARKLAAQELLVQSYGYMNSPTDYKERVEADARYMVETSILARLQSDYATALRQFDHSA